MEESEKIWVWENHSADVADVAEGLWDQLEASWGKYGTPGFTEETRQVHAPGFFGTNEKVDVRFLAYRAEDGELLGLQGCYNDANGDQKNFAFMVNPNHRRKGIGTILVNYVRERYMRERGIDMDADVTFSNVLKTQSGATFVNKYVNDDYAKRNADWQSYVDYVAQHTETQPQDQQ